MKKTITLLFVLLTAISYGQIQKLKDYSAGKFMDSRILYEDANDDVFGYFLLYEFDRKSREVYDLEYVILDKNLNKITSKIFTQTIFKHFMLEMQAKLTFARKMGNEIVFGLYDHGVSQAYVLSDVTSDYFNERYRKINLEDFSLSDEFVFVDMKKIDKTSTEGDTHRVKELKDNQSIYPTRTNHYVLFSPSEYNAPAVQWNNNTPYEKIKKNIKSFSVLDKDLNKLWSRPINQNKDDAGIYRYYTADDNILIMHKKILNKKVNELRVLEVYDLKNGNLIYEINFKDPNYTMDLFKLKVEDDKIIVYNYLHELRDKNCTHEKTLGYARVIYDKNTGKELSRAYMPWEHFAKHFDFKKKFGEINKYGKIFFEDFITLDNGHTIGIAEGYKLAGPRATVLDLFIIEFDPQMNVAYFNKVEKQPNSGEKMTGQSLFSNGAFDYYYSQKLDDDGNYVILYANKEKTAMENSKRKTTNEFLGIITYVDDKFNYDKLQLTTKDGMIVPVRAKNGSILLQEYSKENGMELRLERINY